MRGFSAWAPNAPSITASSMFAAPMAVSPRACEFVSLIERPEEAAASPAGKAEEQRDQPGIRHEGDFRHQRKAVGGRLESNRQAQPEYDMAEQDEEEAGIPLLPYEPHQRKYDQRRQRAEYPADREHQDAV